MTTIYYTFYVIGDMATYIQKDQKGAIILVVFQLPHILTSFLGFPEVYNIDNNKTCNVYRLYKISICCVFVYLLILQRLPIQILCIVLRVFGLILSFCHLHISFIFFDRMQTIAVPPYPLLSYIDLYIYIY